MHPWDAEIRQIDNPYQSTVALESFLSRQGCFRDGTEVLDLGCGLGAALYYFRSKHPGVRFLGLDHNAKKVALARKIAKERKVAGLDFEVAGFDSLPQRYGGRFDGVVSIHTVCCLKRIEDAIEPLIRMRPRWIAINSLFHDSDLDVLIHMREHYRPEIPDSDTDGDFNIFSLKRTAAAFAAHGYDMTSEPFFPPAPIPRRTDGRRGTYTVRTEWHENTQFSGPVFLPWHFVLGRKTTAR